MAAHQNQLIENQRKTDSPTIIPDRVSKGRSLNKLAHRDQPISDGCEKPKKTQKLQIVKTNPDERSGRQWQEPVINGDDKKVDDIIAEYEKADFNRRLQMYLQLPQFGSEFDAINRNMPISDWPSEFELRGRSFAAQMGMALGSAMGCSGM